MLKIHFNFADKIEIFFWRERIVTFFSERYSRVVIFLFSEVILEVRFFLPLLISFHYVEMKKLSCLCKRKAIIFHRRLDRFCKIKYLRGSSKLQFISIVLCAIFVIDFSITKNIGTEIFKISVLFPIMIERISAEKYFSFFMIATYILKYVSYKNNAV